MATFDNVTYTYYSDTLGRAVVPNETEFNALKLLNIQLFKKWLPYCTELEENGIDNAVCMMIETEYQDNQIVKGLDDSAVSSESVGGHSYSYGSTAKNKLEELNAVSTEKKKYEVAKLFCSFDFGVK